jgi:microcystin-dependent protein
MSEPFLAEIRIVGFNFAPRGWAFCDGQILPINQNQSLYSLLGTTYGGDGRTTFALPDLRGRVPIHVGEGYREGQKGGSETVALTREQMPNHSHEAKASSDPASTPVPTGNVLASSAPGEFYHRASDLVPLERGTIGTVGGGQGHNNMQPFLALNFCIALQGLFPSRN